MNSAACCRCRRCRWHVAQTQRATVDLLADIFSTPSEPRWALCVSVKAAVPLFVHRVLFCSARRSFEPRSLSRQAALGSAHTTHTHSHTVHSISISAAVFDDIILETRQEIRSARKSAPSSSSSSASCRRRAEHRMHRSKPAALPWMVCVLVFALLYVWCILYSVHEIHSFTHE